MSCWVLMLAWKKNRQIDDWYTLRVSSNTQHDMTYRYTGYDRCDPFKSQDEMRNSFGTLPTYTCTYVSYVTPSPNSLFAWTFKCEAKMAKSAPALPFITRTCLLFIITCNVFVTPFTTIHQPRSRIRSHSFAPLTSCYTRTRSLSTLAGKWDDLLDDEFETTNVS